jgi:hypothetical protein
MAETKTKPAKGSAAAFIKKVESEQKRRDSRELLELMQEITGEPATMWGPSIVGFGRRHYKYASGREGDMPLTGFAPRKDGLVLYIGQNVQDKKWMAKLGKCRTGKGCLYVKKLDDIDRGVLRELLAKSVEEVRKAYPAG